MDAAAMTATVEVIKKAVRLFLQDNPAIDPALASDIVAFNWDRGVSDLDDLIEVQQYANAFADGE